jgi:catechol 2,3-dioxygenase-like lactoylglutathione lyase family enzyme
VEILSSRVLVRPRDPAASRRFYRDVLGLAVYREFGPPDAPSLVFFLGSGFLELSGHAPTTAGAATPATDDDAAAADADAAGPPDRTTAATAIWLQVRDVATTHGQLAAADVTITRPPLTEPWGLIEMWITDPDGRPIVLVEIPADHPLRRDNRPAQ